MTYYSLSLLPLLLACFFATRRTALAEGTPHDAVAVDHAQSLIDWLQSKEGGFVNPKIEIRRDGVFATDRIAESELILVVPDDALFVAGDEDDTGETEQQLDDSCVDLNIESCPKWAAQGECRSNPSYMIPNCARSCGACSNPPPLVKNPDDGEELGGTLPCGTIRKLLDEISERKKGGDASDFAPYVNYLLNQTENGGRIPTRSWSVAGQSMLFSVLGKKEKDWVKDAWVKGCGGNADEFEIKAAITVDQWSWGHALVPLMEMINHRNGRHTNVEHISTEDDSVTLVASRAIELNEQLHLSYNHNFCGDDCWSRRYDYGTTEILFEYGFVEDYPQRWILDKYIAFDIDEREGEGSSSVDALEVTWVRGQPSRKRVAFLREELSRLKALNVDGTGADGDNAVPKRELDIINQYHQALMTALIHAIDALPKNVGPVDHGKALVDWLRAKGGYFNPKIEVRRADPSDPTSHYGVFANGNIARGENLVVIPQNAMIVGEGDFDAGFEELECGPLHALIDEMNKGDRSDFAPYLNYLLDQPEGRIPTAWSEAGQRLLHAVVGFDEVTHEQEIPPIENTCEIIAGPFELNVAFLVTERSWDQIMVPILDMINHRNGNWLNTEYNSPQGGLPVYVDASMDIKEGQELYTSYNLCPDCSGRHYTFGTPEVLRDYGFVESYPQRWIFDSHATKGSKLSFEIDELDIGSNEFVVHWLHGKPYKEGIEFMQKELARLSKVEVELKQANGIEPHELSTIKRYHDALKLALTHAIEAAMGKAHHRAHVEDAAECPALDWNSIKNYHEALTTSMEQINDYVSGTADNSGLDEDVVEIPAAEWNRLKKHHEELHTYMAHAIEHAPPGEAHNHDP